MANVSTFGAFTSARLGMYAAMKGLTVTGQNISNINTKGYTRQMLDQRALKLNGSDRYYSIYDANVGSGVLCTGVSQLRDPYLDIRFRNEQASVGAMDAKLAGLDNLSSILDEVTKGDGNGVLEKQFNDLMKQLNNLTLSPGSQEQDGQVKASASTLVTLLNNYAKKLESMKQEQVTDYNQDVGAVNDIMESIRNLNETIQKSEVHGDAALELRDQRNVLLDKLSNYMKIDVTYKNHEVAPGTFVQKLVVTLDDGNQTPLIDGLYSGKLSVTQPNDDFKLEVSALENRTGGIHPTHDTATALGGKFYGSLESTRKMLTDAGEFTVDANGNPAPTTERGFPYYQKSLDALANQFAAAMNEANKPYEVDSEGYYLDATGNRFSDGTTLLNKNNTLTAAQKAIVEQTANRLGGDLFSNNNSGAAPITAANISISADWTSGALKVQVSDQKGSTNPTNVAHILYVLTDKNHDFSASTPPNPNPPPGSNAPILFTGTFQKMLANTCSTLASDRLTTTTMLENYATSATTLDASRDSVSGVDLNDEAANMMQYQKSYAAAARLMTTIDEALDKLINSTGIVGR